MAKPQDREQPISPIDSENDELAAPGDDDPTPAPIDPGGAHAKGYSADPGPQEDVDVPDPVPLAPGPSKHPAVRVPERDNNVHPTGRSEPGDSSRTID
jgi:hypothetical protein